MTTNQVFKAMLSTLKAYHSHLDIARDNVKIEIWKEDNEQFFSISQTLELCGDKMTHTYIYNDLDNTFMLAMID